MSVFAVLSALLEKSSFLQARFSEEWYYTDERSQKSISNKQKTEMKKRHINILKAMMMAVISISAMTFASCSDDDDEPKNTLKLTPANVEIAPKATATVTIGSGTAPFTVNSSNTKVATVAVTDKSITITGVAEGSAFVKVIDKNNQTGQVIVTVKEPLALDKASVEVEANKTVDVTVSKGTAPYTATVKDSKVATVSVKDSKVTIKGVKAGKTTVTVTDKNKKTATISVTVK